MKEIDLKALLLSLKWSLQRIWALFRNEIESLLKDKQSLLIVFILPIVILIPFYRPPGEESGEGSMGLFGAADGPGAGANITAFAAPSKIGVLDIDNSSGYFTHDLSENFTRLLVDNSSYEVIMLNNTEEGVRLIENGEIIGYIIIPENFEKNLSEGKHTTIQFVVDATDVEASATITTTLEVMIALFKVTNGFIRDEIYPIPHQAYQKTSPIYSSGPIIFAIMIFGAGMLLSSQCIVGDEPLKRTLLTPAGKLEVIIAKTLAYSGIHLVQVQLMLLITMTIFRLPVYCPFYIALFMEFLVAFCGSMIGMFLSMVAKTRLQANQYFLVVFIVLLLALLFVTDPNVTAWLPMYQAVDGFTSVAYKGFTIEQKPWPFFSIGLISVIFFVLTIVVFYFKKTIE